MRQKPSRPTYTLPRKPPTRQQRQSVLQGEATIAVLPWRHTVSRWSSFLLNTWQLNWLFPISNSTDLLSDKIGQRFSCLQNRDRIVCSYLIAGPSASFPCAILLRDLLHQLSKSVQEYACSFGGWLQTNRLIPWVLP